MANRWLPVAAYGAVSAANQMLWLTYAPITTEAAHHYGVSIGAIGWLSQIFPMLYVVLALPMGRIIDRWLPQGLAAGAALTAVGAIVRLIGTSFTIVLVGQVLIAIAQPLILNAVTRLPASYLRPESRATGIAVASAGTFAGMVCALLLGALIGGRNIGTLLVVQAVLGVAAAIWLALALRIRREHAPADAERVALRRVLGDPLIRILTGMVLAGFGVFVAMTTWLQPLLAPAGITETQAGLLLLTMVIAGVIGAAVLPTGIARAHKERTFLCIAVIAAALCCLLLAVLPTLATAFVALVIVGAALLTALPVLLEIAERRAGSAGGSATGLLWMAGNFGGLVVAVVVQLLVHQPTVSFVVMGACLVAALPLLRPLQGYLPGRGV